MELTRNAVLKIRETDFDKFKKTTPYIEFGENPGSFYPIGVIFGYYYFVEGVFIPKGQQLKGPKELAVEIKIIWDSTPASEIESENKREYRLLLQEKKINETRPKPTDNEEQNKRLENLEKVIEVFKIYFEEKKASSSVELSSKKQDNYSEEELAREYAKIVSEYFKDQPSQSRLSRESGISQPTWSRAFKSLSFWEAVDREIRRTMELGGNRKENQRRAQNHCLDSIESLKYKTKKITFNDGETFQGDEVSGKEKSRRSKEIKKLKQLSDENLALSKDRIDAVLEINKMQKPGLLQLLLKESPELRREDYEEMDIHDLRKFVIESFFPT